MSIKYNHKEIEKKWQIRWAEADLFEADNNSSKEKKYILDMFPYPSGAGLHVGHVESYTATDIYSRYLRMKGYNVMHPQGWDAFGLPAENYAIKTNIHPSKTTTEAVRTFKSQMNSLGLSYDWSREVNSSHPDYYKWTQWFFLLLYKNNLAYRKKAKVNWCDNCQTVLANEQAEGGKCERCESEVIQKDLEQWFFRITDFIEDQELPHPDPLLKKEREKRLVKGLLSGLGEIDWPESTKMGQKNWIGKSEGAIVKFRVILESADRQTIESRDPIAPALPAGRSLQDDSMVIEVFTTRPDTLFGATYFVLSPEHPIVEKFKNQIKNYKEVDKYIQETKKKTELERTDLAKEKTGVELKGIKVINPVNNEKIPVWIADYVLMGYGTGAIMAVPAHDERDFEFAQKYKLPIINVVKPPALDFIPRNAEDIAAGAKSAIRVEAECWTQDGENINSDFLNGLETTAAKKKMIEWLEGEKLGKGAINYKIRDWLVSRQRYWGAPIPIVYCEFCGEVPVPEKDLPVELPTDVDFKPTGESPLKYSKEFQNVKCPKCGAQARRESDTMDTFVCSSWYYFRYADPKNTIDFANKEILKKWLPVDVYVGGAEHTVLHLLYSRFFTKVLKKYGYIDFDEPFTKMRHQGTILAEDGSKMSKSKGNVINPDDVIKEYGADTLRMYEMFMGPLEDAKPWDTKGIIGIKRFLDKVWRLKLKVESKKLESNNIENILHKTIKKVGEDIELFKFNTAIAQMMIMVNNFEKEEEIPEKYFELFLRILHPFAPHLTEELWSQLGNKDYIAIQKWPEYDPKLVIDETIELVLQVNGKIRDTIEVDADISEKEAKKLALESEKIKKWTDEKEVIKVIFVKNKLVNIVIK
jgi:leucyl-tRNA synthetase